MTKEDVAINNGLCKCHYSYQSRGLKDPDCPWHQTAIEEAMDAWAKIQSESFLEWHTNQQAKYIHRLKGELDKEAVEFEKASISERYELFIKQQP